MRKTSRLTVPDGMQMMFSRILKQFTKKLSSPLCPAINRVLRDDCLDAGGRAMNGAIAGKARMRGCEIKLLSFILSPLPNPPPEGEGVNQPHGRSIRLSAGTGSCRF